MRLFFLIVTFLLIANALFAQEITGRIVNDDDATPLAGVVVENINSNGYHTVSDENGNYKIDAKRKDTIRFSFLGYSSRLVVYSGENEGWFSWIAMRPRSFVIDTVVIHKGLTEYQKDSLGRRELYGKAVDYRPAKPQLPKLKELEAGKPFVIKAPISGFIEKRQKKYKRLKAFQERYTEEESLKFIDSRYSPDSVGVLTGLSGDSLFRFMQSYPMSYSFARAASSLEIKMWIKYNYKLWMKLQEEKKP